MGKALQERELQNPTLIRGELIQDGLSLLGPPFLVQFELLVSGNIETLRKGFEGRPTLPLAGSVDEPTPSNHGYKAAIAGLGRLETVGALPDIEENFLNRIFRVGRVH
jgi:hypothetical protein